jgi:oligopeptide transport system ATP-binding protein
MPEPLLQARDLSRHYQTRGATVRALDGVDLDVFPGETLAVVGESGSGKTTLANLILGAEQPTAGTLRFQAKALTARRPLSVRRQLQYVQQNPMTTLNPRRSVFQSVRLPLQTHKLLPPAAQRARVAELLEIVGMSVEYLDRFPAALSGGQRQRVAIARAIAADPTLVVLDEPTSALDVSVQAKALALLVDLQKRFQLTYIFITHDLSVVRNVATRVAVMYRGRIVELAPTEVLFHKPEHPYTRMLISSIPVVSDEEEPLKPDWPWERQLEVSSSARSDGCSFAPRCPFAQPLCWSKPPLLIELRDGHQASCHLAAGVLTPLEAAPDLDNQPARKTA